MKKIALIDDSNNKNKIISDGASTKTENVFQHLSSRYKVKRFIFSSWKTGFFCNFFKLLHILYKYDIVVILPNDARLKIFCLVLKHFVIKSKKPKIIYMVVGGWLPDFLPLNKKTSDICKDFLGIFPETKGMTEKILKLGFENVYYSPVFTLQCQIKSHDDFVLDENAPIPVCTFSRISIEKGIIVAIEAVKKANEIIGKKAYKINLYGRIMEKNYEKFFLDYFDKNKDLCSYEGVVESDDLVDTLNSNFLLLFPTYYYGEGFPGTLVESYYAWLPVIATIWKYNEELVSDGMTGYLVEPKSIDDLANRLVFCFNHRFEVLKMRENCHKAAENLTPDYSMEKVCALIDKELANHK